MELIIGALALFVTFLIVPAFLLAGALAAVIPLAGIGLVGNLITSRKARRAQDRAREPLVAVRERDELRDQPRDEDIPRVA